MLCFVFCVLGDGGTHGSVNEETEVLLVALLLSSKIEPHSLLPLLIVVSILLT